MDLLQSKLALGILFLVVSWFYLFRVAAVFNRVTKIIDFIFYANMEIIKMGKYDDYEIKQIHPRKYVLVFLCFWISPDTFYNKEIVKIQQSVWRAKANIK